MGLREWAAARQERRAADGENWRLQGVAAGILDRALAGEEAWSSGDLSVDGADVEHSYRYRLTATRLLWNRAEVSWGRPAPDGHDPAVTEVSFADVTAFQVGDGGRLDVVVDGRSIRFIILPTGDGIPPGPLFAARRNEVMVKVGALLAHGHGSS